MENGVPPNGFLASRALRIAAVSRFATLTAGMVALESLRNPGTYILISGIL